MAAPPHPPSGIHLDLNSIPRGNGTSAVEELLPPLAALFLIRFDTKKGYTISWRQTAEGVTVDLDGVEFKSLPSGLHKLTGDLVYFVHGSYAGISAFINVAAGVEERGALMVSVGVLVPLSYGRLGRCWRHAEGLKKLASRYTTDTSNYTLFEDYYEQHKFQGAADMILETPVLDASPQRFGSHSQRGADAVAARRNNRSRSVSEPGTALVPGQTLSQSHPALSLGEFMNTLGPLIFPIYRAALARKRILLVTHAPVELACNFVYDISILSNIPLSVTELLPTEPSRLKPLFNIGVHDIPLLETEAKIRKDTTNPPTSDGEHGAWIACTTDEVLSFKGDLWDVIIHLPAPHTKQASEKIWPTIFTSDGTPVKATQRDLRRFRALRRSLKARYSRKRSLFLDSDDDAESPDTPMIRQRSSENDNDTEEPNNIESVCEKLGWREIAYSSFIWWASAGEKRSDEESEDSWLPFVHRFQPYTANVAPVDESTSSGSDTDTAGDATASSSSPGQTESRPRRRRLSAIHRKSTNLRQEGVGSEEMDVIAYFHLMTQKLFSVLSDALDSDSDDGVQEEDERQGLVDGDRSTPYISLDEIERMGLDRYSNADAEALKDIVGRWWGKDVEVEIGRFGCCGIECG